MSGPSAARLVAAVGVACGLAAVWLGANPGAKGGHVAYWHDHTLGGTMLGVGILTAALLIAAQLTRRHALDVAAATAGGVLFGMFLFIPTFWAPSTLGNLGVGGWLGLCTVLAPLGMLSLPPDAPPAAPTRAVRLAGVVATLVGAGLVIGGVFPGAFSDRTGYWDSLLRELGICLIVVAALTAALVLLDLWRTLVFASDSALVLAGVALGFGGYTPANAAFNHLGVLGYGAWLVLGGAVLLLLGVLAERGSLGGTRAQAG